MTSLIAASLGAQASPLVPPAARVYRQIDRLGSLGLIDSLMMGVRPWSEREVARLLDEALANLDRNPAARAWALPVIRAQRARYAPDTNRILDEANAEVVALSSPVRPAPSDANGVIDAGINPLVSYRGGRIAVDGTTLGVETEHGATLGRYFAVNFSPRAFTALRNGRRTFEDVDVQRANATAMLGELGITVGRDYVTFSQAPNGGLLLSNQAPPLDMIRVWNDRAWQLPLLSRLFGPVKGELFVADLGADRVLHPHTKLIGYHVTMLPHPRFEMGFEVIDAMGGNGGQAATFGDRVLDVIPVIDAFRTKSDFLFSNKLAGIDFSWRMPRWAGLRLYIEAAADDFDGRDFGRGLTEDAGYLVGASVSCFLRCGAIELRAEYHQTGIRYYTHTDYPLSTNGFLLGDPLGPRGVGGFVSLDAARPPYGRVTLVGAFEARSGNTYRSVTTGANEAGFHFELVSRRPSEKRARATAAWTNSDISRFAVDVTGGVERVHNFAFVPSQNRTNWLMRVAVVARP